jgi:hypothetical protein
MNRKKITFVAPKQSFGMYRPTLNPSILFWIVSVKRTDLIEIGWDGMDWIDLAQDRDQWRALVNTVMNLRVP